MDDGAYLLRQVLKYLDRLATQSVCKALII